MGFNSGFKGLILVYANTGATGYGLDSPGI